ncbi:MAG: hypothetical protein ACFE8L_11310 [Candidatus Hodarchaeota archaeon]
MTSEWAIICKLGGYVNSNPEILSSYPDLEISSDKSKELLSKCLPIGAKTGDFIMDKYDKYSVLSYVFKIPIQEDRDDLFSISVLLAKKNNPEIYKPVLKKLINYLELNHILSERVLMRYQKAIYNGINEEKDIIIESIEINLSKIFEDIKSKLIKPKPDVKGSFF